MQLKPLSPHFNDFIVERDYPACIKCKVCIKQCSYGVHSWDEKAERVIHDSSKCVGCQRCAAKCPTHCITILQTPAQFRENEHWTPFFIRQIYKQSDTGGILLSGMGCPRKDRIYWDHLQLDASQVTNPSIDPLREPMELRTYLGSKPTQLVIASEEGGPRLLEQMAPQLKLETPLLFGGMSFGAINLNLHEAMARAAEETGILFNTGEGGLHESLYKYGANTIVQVASGRFGVHSAYLEAGVAVEIKIGQGAKPGIGGHLPGEKIDAEVSKTRMIPQGADAISPAPHHDIYSIEDLLQLIYALKEATRYKKPIFVKIAAVHNAAAIASGIARAGADVIVIDGYKGGTGAAPTMIRDNVGIPLELALATVDDRLREEGIRSSVSLVAGGGIRCSADVFKAIALGADAVNIGTAALIAVGCTMCGRCYTGKCPWGIATNHPALKKRQNPDEATQRLVNLINAWSHEIMDILGGMGLNSIESLRGNRDKLRAVGLLPAELEILGVKHAGR